MAQDFQEIIEFAIARENEAANFYGELATKVKQDSSIAMLKEFEKMELKHAEILKHYQEEHVKSSTPRQIQDMKLSDYMVEPDVNKELTFREIIVLAMKREESAKKLYTKMASEAESDDIKKLFERLASEEAKHKLQLETMYDEEMNYEN